MRTAVLYNCIPIIMVSAKSKEENIVEGLLSGSNDYLVKPFGRQEILARIQSHLRFRDAVWRAGDLAGAWIGGAQEGGMGCPWAGCLDHHRCG